MTVDKSDCPCIDGSPEFCLVHNVPSTWRFISEANESPPRKRKFPRISERLLTVIGQRDRERIDELRRREYEGQWSD